VIFWKKVSVLQGDNSCSLFISSREELVGCPIKRGLLSFRYSQFINFSNFHSADPSGSEIPFLSTPALKQKLIIVSSLRTVLPHCPLSPMLAVALLCRRRYADLWIVEPKSSH
jgi:hypothetical protein